MLSGRVNMPIRSIVSQHVQEASWLRQMRARAVRAANSTIVSLTRLDARLAAHLDGLCVAHAEGANLFEGEVSAASDIFAKSVLSLECQVTQELNTLFRRAEIDASVRRAVASAMGWVSERNLKGIVRDLLQFRGVSGRLLGLIVCSLHRVDAQEILAVAAMDSDGPLRARALRSAGELGRVDLLGVCRRCVSDRDADVSFWAARSALLLGDRANAFIVLRQLACRESGFRTQSLDLLLMSSPSSDANGLLRDLASDPSELRMLIRGAGASGDARYVPWLLSQMEDARLARLAGESISVVTGVNIAAEQLDRPRPEEFQLGPNDDPNDPNVDMDEDDGLPWPDVTKIKAWWRANAQNFKPGTRYFMGEPLNRDNCLHVLKDGFQRQRIAAAYYLCLLNPGAPLFEWRAPAWRQQRQLAGMT